MVKSSRGIQLGSGRETNLRRQPSRRAPRKTILIDTNGKSTEQAYFNALKTLQWAQASRVVVVFKNGAPVDVVRDAGKRKTDNDFDEAWAVCDVDEFETERAMVEARRKDVGLAWSNPCFELWLILHLAAQKSHLENGDKACEKISKPLGKDFDKTEMNFADFEHGIEEAVGRAKLLEQPPAANPSTNVWAVLESLGFGMAAEASDGVQVSPNVHRLTTRPNARDKNSPPPL
jgi:hypothetical protein